jgi:hypothetical protein
MLILLLLIPRHAKISAEVAGLRFDSLAPVRDLMVLLGSIMLARLTGLMADGARLAAMLNAKFVVTASSEEKKIVSIEVGDLRAEETIFEDLSGFSRLIHLAYWIVRVAEGVGHYVLLLAIVGAMAYMIGRGVQEMWLTPSLSTPIWQVVLALTVIFVFQAALSLAQYWLIRRIRS